MKNLFLTLIVTIFTFGFGVPEAEAKRLGGGSNFGMQRQATPPAAAPQQNLSRPPAAAPAAGAAPKRSWMGPIAGLAAGLGLAALFSHLGMGEELASFMMIALLVVGAVILFKLLFRRNNAQASQGMQYAGAGAGANGAAGNAPAAFEAQAPLSSSTSAPAAAIPADFDAEGFARQAKLNFIRLQAANDAGNLDDIREFTTPEMFAEIRMQLTERGPMQQRTDVVELNAEVVDVVEESARYIVSVRFNGLLREEAEAAPTAFDEIWHLTKPAAGNEGWRIAGIQQIS